MKLTKFKNLCSEKYVIPIEKKIIVDGITPIGFANSYFKKDKFVALESAFTDSIGKNNRFSYFCNDFHSLITYNDETITLQSNNKIHYFKSINFFDFLKNYISKFKTLSDSKFKNGIIGHISYECVDQIETIDFPENREIDIPKAKLFVPRNIFQFDHLKSELTIIRNVFPDEYLNKSFETIYHQKKSELEQIIKDIQEIQLQILPPLHTYKKAYDKPDLSIFEFNISDNDFLKKAEECKKYIKQGDIFQIQLSRRMKTLFNHSNDFLLYRYLRHKNPSPWMFFIKDNDYSLLGSSPELLVNVSERVMNIRPIAGTRKRKSPIKTEDEIVTELLSCEKEKAEHIMLVDLARNEISKSCEYGSVKVNELFTIEKYSHVIHLVSDVIGKLRKETTAVDAFIGGYPAGTISGAPKVRAMEIISEMETSQREFYSGGIVFFDFNDNLKSALTIRSVLLKDGYAYGQAAAGIVADSEPHLELKETLNKLGSVIDAINACKGH